MSNQLMWNHFSLSMAVTFLLANLLALTANLTVRASNSDVHFNCHTFFLQPLIGSVQYMCKFGLRESVTMGERLTSSAVKFNEKVCKLKLLLNQLYTMYTGITVCWCQW